MKDKTNANNKKNVNKKMIFAILSIVVILTIIVIAVFAKNAMKKGAYIGDLKKDIELKLKLSQNSESISAFFDYPKNVGMSVQDSSMEDSIEILNKKKNYILRLTLADMVSENYQNKQESKKELAGYEEIKFGKYNGYVYKYTDGIMEGCILLDTSDDICRYIAIKLKTNENIIKGEWTEIEPIYNLEEIKKVLNSFEYRSNGIVK